MSFIEDTIQYVRASRAELLKVSWPSRRDTVRYSALVIAVSVIVAIFFGLLDLGLGKIVQLVVTRAPQAIAEPAAPVVPTTDAQPAAPPSIEVQGQAANGQPINVEKVEIVPSTKK